MKVVVGINEKCGFQGCEESLTQNEEHFNLSHSLRGVNMSIRKRSYCVLLLQQLLSKIIKAKWLS